MSRIDDLQDQLYRRGEEQEQVRRTGLSMENIDASKEFTVTQTKPVKQSPPELTFFLTSLVIFLLCGLLGAFFFLGGFSLVSDRNVSLVIDAPKEVRAGEEMQLRIIVKNNNPIALLSSRITIDTPVNVRLVDASEDGRVILDTIASGETREVLVRAIPFGKEGEEVDFNVRFEYTVERSNLSFRKEAEHIAVVSDTPVSMSLEVPIDVVSGQVFDLVTRVRSQSEVPLNNLVLAIEAPFGFEVLSSSHTVAANNAWTLGTIEPGAEAVVTLSVRLLGEDGDIRFVRTSVREVGENTPVIAEQQAMITLAKPFIGTTVRIGGVQAGQALPAGRQLSGEVLWKNNLGSTVRNVSITLAFAGSAIDMDSIDSGEGFYQSRDGTITWTPAEIDSLGTISPGESGSLRFTFRVRESNSPDGVVMTTSVLGERIDENGGLAQITGTTKTIFAVRTSIAVAAATYVSTGPFTNTGPVPPVANKDTTYSIQLSAQTSTSPIQGATVVTQLPAYVTFIQAESGKDVLYNEGSRTLTWHVGRISPEAPQTAYIQVRLSPSTSQKGGQPQLTGTITLRGTDTVSGSVVTTSVKGPTTRLSDPGKDIADGVVGG